MNHHIIGQDLRIFGVAYWDTVGTVASTVFDKLVGGAILGPIGTGMTRQTHHIGVIAVTENKLYVIETRTIVGEEVKAVKVVAKSAQGKATSFDLKDVKVQDKASTTSGILKITGAFDLKRLFRFPTNREWNIRRLRLLRLLRPHHTRLLRLLRPHQTMISQSAPFAQFVEP